MNFQTLILQKVWQTLHWFFYWTIWWTFFVRNKPSPKPRINNYSVAPDGTLHVILGVPASSIWTTKVGDTKSMDPLFDSTDTVVLAKAEDVGFEIGDVIVYAKNNNDSDLIIHQIVAESSDSEGRYFTCKGTNNPLPDRLRVRPSWVRHVMLAVLY